MSDRTDLVVVMDDDYGSLKFYVGLLWKARPTQVVGQAESPPALLAWLRERPTRVDVVVVDAEYRDQSLPLHTLVQETLERAPDVRVVCLSQYGDPDQAQNAVRGGARAYLLKNEVGPALPRTIAQTSARRLVVTPGVAPALKRLAWELSLDFIIQHPWAPSPYLTPRQVEVLWMAAVFGTPAKLVAHELCLEESTVRSYLRDAYDVLEGDPFLDHEAPTNVAPIEFAFEQFIAPPSRP